TSPVAEPQTRDAQAAARALGVKLTVLSAVTENDFEQVFASLAEQRADALLVSADPLFASRREQLVALAARHAVPALYEIREFVEAGGLMSYGTVLGDGYYKGGNYIARILKGTTPADLPVEQIEKFELVINVATAKALGLTVPDRLLALADEVGVVISSDSFFFSQSAQLARLALRHAVPTIFGFREFVAAGGLMSYGGSLTESFRWVGVYTGRVLKDEKLANLPVQQSTKIELFINLKTAEALGLELPATLLTR